MKSKDQSPGLEVTHETVFGDRVNETPEDVFDRIINAQMVLEDELASQALEGSKAAENLLNKLQQKISSDELNAD